MNRILRWMCLLLTFLPAGCVTSDGRERPFTDGWSTQVRSEQNFQRRKERLRGDEEIVLMGDSDKARAAVVMDERGRPRLNVGRKTGWSADLDYDEGPEARLKYKLKWDFAKPKRGNQKTSED